MLTLLTHGGGDGFYSYSMFCTKAALLLQMSGEDWQRQDVNDPAELASMPHHKLPVLRDETGALIPDSEGIRRFLEARGAEFDPGLSDLQKAQSRLLIRMVDEALWLHLMCARWLEDDGWAGMTQTVFAGVPAPVAEGFRAKVMQGLHFTGHSRLDRAERLLRLGQDLTALEAVLGDQPYLFGDRMTAADCSAATMLDALSRAPAARAVAEVTQNHPRLMTYVARIMEAAAADLPKAA
ncbi:glutathione S-transferase family protein [Phaeobacter sp. HF9A]|uniref:glutathione S-transferase family protein n=1 Tax=Phaeobacter sp. HF9A TaxID=2721561 RepID=UPI0014300552|nr:glutathione S-transferase family protein [Phaeobacter sp. HF9A]NIZ13270.1 glutathione S-transferase family protein [Phaeobacter sp. HF9A]